MPNETIPFRILYVLIENANEHPIYAIKNLRRLKVTDNINFQIRFS